MRVLGLLISLVVFPALTTTVDAGTRQDVTACGADPTGAADSAPAIQNCINFAGRDGVVYFPAGQYKIGSTVTVSNHGVTLYSDSPSAAKLNFSGCGDLLKFSKNDI